MAKLSFLKGTTSKRMSLFIQDSTSTGGNGLTGLVFNSAGLTAYYYLEGAASATAITLVTATVGTYTSGGFKEIDAANMPGWYFFCPPNAALTGANSVGIHLKGATNMVPLPLEVELTAWDNQDAVRGGLTALPNAAAGATGGLDCAVAFGGTATAGAANSITLPAGGSAVDNIYNHQVIQITGGTGVGQARMIVAYNGTTKVAIVSRSWRTNPDGTSVFQVKGFDFQPSTSVVGGFVQAATGTTLTLPATASAVDNFYNGGLMEITGGTAVGQSRVVKGYNGTTKVVTVARPFDTTPDTTSVVLVVQAAQPAIDTNLAVDVANVNTGAIVSGSFAVDSITSASLSTGAATEIAGAVWDEARSGHTTAGSFGQGVASVQGNVTGSVGSVTGAVGSVTGAVGSVTGNVGGNVTGSVGSVASGGIVAASFATDSITSAALSTGAATEISGAVWDEARASHTTAGSFGQGVASVQGNVTGSAASVTGAVGSVTGNVGGNVVGSTASVTAAVTVGTINANVITATSIATDAITAAKIAADAIGASELATDAVAEIQAAVAAGSVASVVGAVGSVTGNVGGNVVGSIGSVATGGIVSGSFAVDSITSASLSSGATGEIADAVWDDVLSGHLTAGTTGAALNAATTGGDPWATALPGSYASGTAGNILGNRLDAAVSTRLATSGYTAPPSAATIASQIIATTLTELPAASLVSATPTVGEALMLPFMRDRNGMPTTATSRKIRNAAGTTIMKATMSDDTVTFEPGQLVAGP